MTENEASEGNLGGGRSDLGEADHRFMREHTAGRSLYEDMIHHPYGVEADLLREPRLLRDLSQPLGPVGGVVIHLQRHADLHATHRKRRHHFLAALAARVLLA